ncbi:seryl-trna synthetase, (serine--trna ligase) (serrs) [Eimeria tenella]|uniref:serine--tRNA ligase n=1 Tax=Eimeria tenella TaxID=5802 RepID=C8TDZ2_EIMTE|nr:seryl-trna synthetase, (serine--trna ligase) (serrs) [Eimeria tenella]
MYMSPTSEVSLLGLYSNEDGNYGSEHRGLYRQRTFYKTEVAAVCTPEQSEQLQQQLLQHAEQLLQALQLPYRVVQLCAGETAFAAAVCFDLEVWMPGLQRFLEVSSVSNCRDYQARRLNLRFRNTSSPPQQQQQQQRQQQQQQQGRKRPQYCHTLNGTALAVGRVLAALVENHHCTTDEGEPAVKLPPPLRPFFNGKTYLTRGP